MKNVRMTGLLFAAALTGCATVEGGAPQTAESVVIPTEAEADAAAEATIGEENADDELLRLQEEIEGNG